ncbi:hypothetical protein GCM10011490_01720 [Pseudoclavibacter endophyticus]|uniref:MBL fold metallo-hydrolase n=1 Tax=Pseudoclavibacter endophyticus TaxID=1778590 RepID=A0A6H9WVU1_9MICO|nr:MBL fold metallo-hydrolase [Pseudoclavibacter endophyticus]KAB1650280.1 MBL fold metallo-hydrolase [Pseudoclavibacter endophyticus]GGA55518.1 hypothetical protein GCM10011490_01720 [Pseudoclavibacter endophyticus]
MTARIDHAVTSGTFSLDGQTFDVDNNVWILGDDTECIVIDAPHDVQAIRDAVGGRTVKAIVCTHAHDDHVRYARELADAVGAPVLLNPADLEVWHLTHDTAPDGELTDGQELEIAGTTVRVLHTPGHSPGSSCLYVEELGTVFTGDTLFNGGPGATGRSFSSWDVILESINTVLFALPDDTVVKTGHGDDTTIGAERANVPAPGTPKPE